MARLKGNAVVGQSGGPTAVINQSMVGVVEQLIEDDHVDQILGARHAVAGMVKNDFVDMKSIGKEVLDRVANSPSAGLGSSRDKPDKAYCEKIFDVFEKNNVRYFFYIGGNDSSDTCRIINELSSDAGYELRCFHVPKTIDNDLVLNDHTPGYGSAAKFVAQAFQGDNLDNRSLPGIKINVVMGRHAGFLTAASMLARRSEEDGPHLVYVPEVAFDLDKFVGDVDAVFTKYGRCLIAVSEGIHDADGTAMVTKLAQSVEQDAHGNVQLSGTGALGDYLSGALKDALGDKYDKLRVRADTFGYLQRCFVGCTSPVDAEEAREAGRTAARVAAMGDLDGSIAIQRAEGDVYKAAYKVVQLKDVAGKTRVLDPAWIENDNNIAESFKDYALPLVGKLPVIETI